MPQVLGFDVSVEVDGNKLPEYKLEVSLDPTLGVPVKTCWIPSEAGKEFCIAVEPPLAPRSSHWAFTVKLDGTPIKINNSALLKSAHTPIKRLKDELVAANVARPLLFATIQLTDDDAALHSASPELGSIALVIDSVDEYVRGAPATHFSAVQAAGPVHEKAKKAFVHRIGFGEKHQMAPSTWWTPIGKRTRAIVIFKYRNLDILIADDIAPAQKKPIATSASPGPSSSRAAGPSKKRKAKEPAVKIEIEMDEEMDDEEKELEARLAALRAKKRKTSGTVRVKAEVKPRLPPSFIPGEVIDLTED